MWRVDTVTNVASKITTKIENFVDQLKFTLANDVLSIEEYFKHYCEENRYVIVDMSRKLVLDKEGKLMAIKFGEKKIYQKISDRIEITRINSHNAKDTQSFSYPYISLNIWKDGQYDLINWNFWWVKDIDYDVENWKFTRTI